MGVLLAAGEVTAGDAGSSALVAATALGLPMRGVQCTRCSAGSRWPGLGITTCKTTLPTCLLCLLPSRRPKSLSSHGNTCINAFAPGRASWPTAAVFPHGHAAIQLDKAALQALDKEVGLMQVGPGTDCQTFLALQSGFGASEARATHIWGV